MKPKEAVFLGVAVLLAGVAVFFAYVPAPHTGGDNAGYVSLAYSLLTEHRYTELFDPTRPPHTKYPPVFPLLLAGVMLLGARTWASLKIVAALSTVGVVAATYGFARRRLQALGALAVAGVVAFSYAVVYYSHWILSDPTFVFFTLLALWLLDREDHARVESAGDGRSTRGVGGPEPLLGLGGAGLAGLIFVTLAYFTRSAGLPLVVAVFAWLALRRRWRGLGVAGVIVALPAVLWWLRGRVGGTARYGTEFWLVDPYQPGLGRIGPGDLVVRVMGNAVDYVGTHVPAGIVGGKGPAVTLLGVVLCAAGGAGWFWRTRRRAGPVELFFPLYTGLILLWPRVWSGDRFALPLIPLLLVYAAAALGASFRRASTKAVTPLAAVVVLLVFLPSLGSWVRAVGQSRACAAMVERSGPFSCYGPRFTEYAEAAAWAGAHLPAESGVLTRKPRMFYVLSGLPSRTFPFDTRAAAHLNLADSLGVRFELMDQVDNLALRYVGGALQDQPGAYCSVRGFGEGPGIGTQLLGILPPERRVTGRADPEEGVRIAPCPDDYLAASPGGWSYAPRSMRIPLLDGLDR
ncbi:MAG: ArnT family glycosyltransferase [Gemmatimonadota bacterium]